jgi:hypothetical protein
MNRDDLQNKTDHDLLIITAANTEDMKDHLAQLNGRVAKLEQWKAYMTGAIAILGIVLGIIVKVVAG